MSSPRPLHTGAPRPRSRARAREVVWIDGRPVPAARAVVSAFDRGFLYGDAVFETVRAYAGRLFLWPLHERRLAASLRRFRIPRPAVDLRVALEAVLAARARGDAAVRVTVTRGVGEGLLPPARLRPTVVVSARDVPSDLPAQREHGVAAVLLPFGHGRGGVADGHKTNAYLPAILGRIEAAARGAAEAIYVEADGTASEGTTSNLFAVRGGRIATPPLDAGCRPGVTRAIVVRLARAAGLEVEIAPLAARELGAADELFFTASTIEVLPVVRLGRRRIGRGVPGEVTRLLQERYRDFVARTLARSAQR